MNQIIIVGRLVEKPILEESENGRKVSTITLAVHRSFKNDEGYYETDFIPCNLVGQTAETTCEYCQKGDVIGVKGRLARLSKQDLQVIADRVTFLKSGRREEE